MTSSPGAPPPVLSVRRLSVTFTGSGRDVPAVRDIFRRRFPAERIESGSELESIASGLALMGRERDLGRWTMRSTV